MTTAATFCATLVDEWRRAGVTDAVVAPGSRSTPLALALAAAPDVRVHVVHDERSASFTALGLGLATGRPAVVLCTSGTAATHLHGAVVEAHLSAVPLLACTADRPPELWDIGAPQTIDQTRLYGTAVRWFCEPGVPDDAAAPSWRSMASRGVAEAMGWSGYPGPVHYNLSFRDPLVGEPGALPPGRADDDPWHRVASPNAPTPDVSVLAARMAEAADGVIVAGRGDSEPVAVVDLAERLGWPLLADHRSGCRVPARSVAYADLLLRTEPFARRRPAMVLRLGEPPASKVVGQWLAGLDADVIAAMPDRRWIDPERVATRVVPEAGVVAALLSALGSGEPTSREAASWAAADQRVDELLDDLLPAADVTEPAVARAVVDAVPSGGALVIASSMPVRDVEWFGRARADIEVFANRGANGIDGVISTAAGVALPGRPTVCLLGDIAFLHDSAGLTALADRGIDLTLVVVNNDGGGIFSFLPQADALDPDRFELLFGTPHGTDLPALAAAHGLPTSGWGDSELRPRGVRVVVVQTERAPTADLHRVLHDAVAAAVEASP